MSVIQVRKLKKAFGDLWALNGVDFEVKKGEVFGFIGPNGAGKSTTIRVLLGLLRTDGGDAQLLGGDPWHDAVALHRRLAYVPGDVNLWPNLSGGEVIDLLGTLRGGLDHTRRGRLLDQFQLDPSKKCRTYSKGNRQKVALVAAFASDVELFVLDEPTSGLDPLMETVFQECVLTAKQAGKTILLSSHILAEVERLCDRVGVIRDGKIVESGSLAELRHLTRTSITVDTGKTMTGPNQLAGVHDLEVEGYSAQFTVDTSSLDTVIRFLSQYQIRNLICSPPTLEELFMRHYDHVTEGGQRR